MGELVLGWGRRRGRVKQEFEAGGGGVDAVLQMVGLTDKSPPGH